MDSVKCPLLDRKGGDTRGTMKAGDTDGVGEATITSVAPFSLHVFPDFSLSPSFHSISHPLPQLSCDTNLIYLISCLSYNANECGRAYCSLPIILPHRRRCWQKLKSYSNICLPPGRTPEWLSDRISDSWGLNSGDFKINSFSIMNGLD